VLDLTLRQLEALAAIWGVLHRWDLILRNPTAYRAGVGDEDHSAGPGTVDHRGDSIRGIALMCHRCRSDYRLGPVTDRREYPGWVSPDEQEERERYDHDLDRPTDADIARRHDLDRRTSEMEHQIYVTCVRGLLRKHGCSWLMDRVR
jgi:hypothetical protein